MTVTSALQPSLDDFGAPLSEVTFVVVDLETTGGSADAEITEIGAVKVRGGDVLGEFQTLVRPDSPIPPLIQVLTGITNQMVSTAPPIDEVLPVFATFTSGATLVAHNARFDIGFLKRGYASAGLDWPGGPVVDTLALARAVLSREEAPNCKLSTLAQRFAAGTEPNHRALSDARATVDVLHGLLERVGNLGVTTLEDLSEFALRVSPDRRAKRVWARTAPEHAGVYYFYVDHLDPDGNHRKEVLYVGKSNNLRRRLRSYFSAAEKRPRIHEMVRVASGLECIPCATELEAEVRELRMIESLSPRYNRRSRNQRRPYWLTLTDEAFPRLTIVTQPARSGGASGQTCFGPFRTRGAAEEAMMTLHDAFQIRRCTTRLSPRNASSSCSLAELGRCGAPCELGPGATAYPELVQAVTRSWRGDVRPVLRSGRAKLAKLMAQERYEEAGHLTDRLRAYLGASLRFHRVRSLALCPELVAAAPSSRGWDIHVIRYGRLAAATSAPSPRARQAAEEASAHAETVLAPPPGLPASSFDEAERIAAWLESSGVRLIEIRGEWAWPVHAGVSSAQFAQKVLG